MSVESPKPLRVPRPVPLEERPIEGFEAYWSLAETVGAVAGAVIATKVRQVLAWHRIPIYPYQEVDHYLRHLATQQHGRLAIWGWSALRQVDVIAKGLPSKTAHEGFEGFDNSISNEYSYWGPVFHDRRYPLAIPFRVLERVAVVATEVPAVHFYVSDTRAATSGSSFLGVTAEGMEMLVIDQWDEPGFGFPGA